MSVAERRRRRIGQQGFWGFPTKNTRDRATAFMPQLLYERMEELGFDFFGHVSDYRSVTPYDCR